MSNIAEKKSKGVLCSSNRLPFASGLACFSPKSTTSSRSRDLNVNSSRAQSPFRLVMVLSAGCRGIKGRRLCNNAARQGLKEGTSFEGDQMDAMRKVYNSCT
jgi:hypothetical protein